MSFYFCFRDVPFSFESVNETLISPSLIRPEGGDYELKTVPQRLRVIHGYTHGQPRGLVDHRGVTIDVMVVWTKNAECKKSGLAAECSLSSMTEHNMRGLIDLAIAETNTAFTLSGVTSQLRLVYAYREPNYKEDVSNAFGSALSSIRSNTDGVLDEVHTIRNTYGADIVAMIIDSPEHCGMAYSGPESNLMFSVTAWNCATGFYSFGHAIGRNMVCLFVIIGRFKPSKLRNYLSTIFCSSSLTLVPGM